MIKYEDGIEFFEITSIIMSHSFILCPHIPQMLDVDSMPGSLILYVPGSEFIISV